MLSNVTFLLYFFFFNAPATTEIYTLSLHDALPISVEPAAPGPAARDVRIAAHRPRDGAVAADEGPRHHRVQPLLPVRSEEHTSELQSRRDLVCRLLLEKKKKKKRKKYKRTNIEYH